VAWLPGACNTPFLRLNKRVVPGLGRWPLPSEGKGHTFESCWVRHFFFIFQRDIHSRTETPAPPHSSE
jgi:hypothetical protein